MNKTQLILFFQYLFGMEVYYSGQAKALYVPGVQQSDIDPHLTGVDLKSITVIAQDAVIRTGRKAKKLLSDIRKKFKRNHIERIEGFMSQVDPGLYPGNEAGAFDHLDQTIEEQPSPHMDDPRDEIVDDERYD